MWFCLKSEYMHEDWYHTVKVTRDFPTHTKHMEIHQLPNHDENQGYLLYHFVDQECNWIRFYVDREEAMSQFNWRKEAQLKKVIPLDHAYLYKEENGKRFMSSLYEINQIIKYAKQGDRWVLEKVEIN